MVCFKQWRHRASTVVKRSNQPPGLPSQNQQVLNWGSVHYSECKQHVLPLPLFCLLLQTVSHSLDAASYPCSTRLDLYSSPYFSKLWIILSLTPSASNCVTCWKTGLYIPSCRQKEYFSHIFDIFSILYIFYSLELFFLLYTSCMASSMDEYVGLLMLIPCKPCIEMTLWKWWSRLYYYIIKISPDKVKESVI